MDHEALTIPNPSPRNDILAMLRHPKSKSVENLHYVAFLELLFRAYIVLSAAQKAGATLFVGINSR
jgi:hypothetical protein